MNELTAVFASFLERGVLEIRLFDIASICREEKTFFANKTFCNETSDESRSLKRFDRVALSDFVRFLVLDIYEGIYVDGDIIFLKDMQLLWHRTFAYRWGHVPDYNTGTFD